VSGAPSDGAEELAAPSDPRALPNRRPSAARGARAPVFAVFIELYEAALEAIPADRRRRRA
jgi:hypothetical protein